MIDNKGGKQSEFKFGQYIQSDLGVWKLDRGSNFTNNIGANIQVTVTDPSLVADSFVGNVRANMEDKDVPFVDLMFSDSNSKRGEDILNNVIKTYLKISLEEKNRENEATILFINKRIDSISRDLRGDESQLEGYAKGQGLTDINSQSQSYVPGSAS